MKKRIMIVDDSLDILSVVKRGMEYLSDEYEVIGVDSGKKCLKLLKNIETPDLILLDIMMPEMDGWNLFAKIKENPEWSEIPIVFLTAKTDPYSKGFSKLTANDYIEKPFEMDDLKKRINKILS